MEKLDLEKCHKLIIEAYCCSGGIEWAQVIIQDEPKRAITVTELVHLWQVSASGSTYWKCLLPEVRLCYQFGGIWDTIVLDVNVVSVSIIISRSDIFADDPEYTLASYKKAAYRQYTM